MHNSNRYIAFLRGINVGGHAPIKMPVLKDVFEKMGFENVRTLLASGNVIFESEQNDKNILSKEIESELKKVFRRDIKVMLRSLDDLEKLQSLEPFKDIKLTESIRLYVTFLTEKVQPHTMTIPYTFPQKEFSILHETPLEVFSVIDLSKGKGTTDVMAVLEKAYGSNVTTRN